MNDSAKLVLLLRRAFLIFACLAVLLIGYGLPRVSFDNDILALFPHAQQTPGVTQADALIAARVTRKVFFLLHSANWDATREHAQAFVTELQACSCFQQVSASQDMQTLERLQQHYREFTPLLLTEQQREQLQAGRGQQLMQQSLRKLLANPTTGMTETLRYDPFGSLQNFLNQTHPVQNNVHLDEQGFIAFGTEDNRYLLVIGELSDSPYSVTLQQQAQAAIAAAETQFSALQGAEIIKTGVLFYTLAGTTQARAEISTVGLGSALGILLLLLIVFRSLKLIVLAFVPIIFGILFGLVVCNFIFGNVHIVALVFGASLVGIAIDYVLHFFTRRHALAEQWNAAAGLTHLLPALTLGLLSSVAAYLSFTLAGFPGFTQVAVFSCAGLIAAYAVVVGFYPWLLQRPAARPLPSLLVACVASYHRWMLQHIRRIYALPVLVPLVFVVGLGLWQLRVTDDVRAMQIPEQKLLTMEQRFQALVGQRTALQYLLVSAADTELLLQKLEALRLPLAVLQERGVLANYQSLNDYLPSAVTQLNNWQVWQARLIESGLLSSLLDNIGVVPEFNAAVLQRFKASPTALLTLENTAEFLAALPDAPITFTSQNRAYAVVLLQGLSDPSALASLARTDEGLEWVDAVAQTNQLLRDYRLGTALLLVLAYVVLGVLFSWRYSWRGALAIVSPPLLATAVCLALLGWLGQSVSVFNLMALMLVLGIGIDAALFMRESADRSYDTLLAIGLSTLTTLLAFGLLSLSATAAIQSFGQTILLGIIFCFILSPLAAVTDAGVVDAGLKPVER